MFYIKKFNIKNLSIKKLKKTFTQDIIYLNRLSPNIIIFIIYGLLYDVVINVYKPFAVKFLTRLGGGATYITLYNSLPGIVAALALLPGALFMRRYKNLKFVTTVILYITRSFLLLIALTPFFTKTWQPLIFICLISLMNFPEALSQSAIQSSLAVFFKSGNIRAQAISLRNKFGNFSIPIITLITGLIISFIPRSDSQIIIFYQLFFVLAFFIGLVEIRTFKKFKSEPELDTNTNARVPDNSNKKNTGNNMLSQISIVKSVFKNKSFRNYLIFTLIYYVTWQSGWALSSIYQIENLGANEMWLALFAVGSGISSFFSAGFWSKQIAKRGNQKTMVLAGYALALNMIIIGLTPNLPLMVLSCCYSGFASIGLNITLLNGLLQSTPDEDRMVYIGVYNTFVNISLGVSPLLSLILVNKAGLVFTIFTIGCSRIISSTLLLIAAKKKLLPG